MATTKTLAPTNQTITIAAFQGEKPDQRQIADAEGKLADAVNALNSQLGNFTTKSKTSSADLNNEKTPGYYIAGSATQNKPNSGYLSVAVLPFSGDRDLAQFAIDVNTGVMFVRSFHDNTTWTPWQQLSNKYIDKASVTEYTIPLSSINQSHSYGIALIGAYTSLFVLFYINNNTATLTRLSGNLTASITATTSTGITITFGSTVWDGITVMPL